MGRHQMLVVLDENGHRKARYTDSGTSLGVKELAEELIFAYSGSLRKTSDVWEEGRSGNKVQTPSMSKGQ